MKKENEFYLLDTRPNAFIGSTCTFWAKDAKGYVSDLNKAHIFNFEEAQKWADKQNHFLPLSKFQVDALAVARVDIQSFKAKKNTDFSDDIVIHLTRSGYDGNDIYFLDDNDETTANYNEAKVFTPNEALIELSQRSGKIMSKKFLDTICRRTFQKQNINKRKMLGSAGLRYRTPRVRQVTGKYRGNCPKCGKLTWSCNPEYADYCNEHKFITQY